MKDSSNHTTAAALVAVLFAFAACAEIVCFPNKMASPEAAKLAALLPLGMEEGAMCSYFQTNGLTGCTVDVRPARTYSPGAVIAELETGTMVPETNFPAKGTRMYALSDHCWLCLDVSLKAGTLTNRVLQAAYLERDGVKIASITLTNRP